MLRASELFAVEGGVYQVYRFTRVDMSFFDKIVQLGPERGKAADTVEVHFETGNDDQGREGAVVVRTEGATEGGAGGECG